MPLAKAIKENRVDIARFLIENGMRPEKNSGLLHQAVENDNNEMVELLIPFFDVNVTNDDGNTPLHIVNSIDMAKYLLGHGASLDIKNIQGELPHVNMSNKDVEEFLSAKYLALHPKQEIERSVSSGKPWVNRFTSEVITISDLKPVDYDNATGEFSLSFDNKEYNVSSRFIDSLAKKLKFSSNIFNYFTVDEVFDRISSKHQNMQFKATFDQEENTILGVVDESKKILPADVACRVFSEDPRVQSIDYDDGVWKANFALDGGFEVKNDSEYKQGIWLHYPVDGITSPCIYLSVVRMLCENGLTMITPAFRTNIEINDQSGTHLTRLLSSYSNPNGFTALQSRIQSAQRTEASVREFLKIYELIGGQILNANNTVSKLHNALSDLAGDPCARYNITALTNVTPKRRAMLPIGCSVNDLMCFCSELTSHYPNIVSREERIYNIIAGMLAEDFDLEGMYPQRKHASQYYLDTIDLPTEVEEPQKSTEVMAYA